MKFAPLCATQQTGQIMYMNGTTIPGDKFYEWLDLFLQQDCCTNQAVQNICGFSHQPDIVWNDDHTEVVTSRIRAYHTPVWTSHAVCAV